MKFTDELKKRFEGEPAFTSRDIRMFFAEHGLSSGYQNLMVHNLLKQGRLFRITRGAYTFRDEAQAVGFAFPPFYYGLQDALSLRNIWEQETVPVVITARKVRSGRRIFSGSNYIVRHISRKMLFGYGLVKYGDFWVPVSDAEKTIIDLVYFRQPIGKELVQTLRSIMRKDVMDRYLLRISSRLAKRVKCALAKGNCTIR